jgi:hypothetical protein
MLNIIEVINKNVENLKVWQIIYLYPYSVEKDPKAYSYFGNAQALSYYCRMSSPYNFNKKDEAKSRGAQ